MPATLIDPPVAGVAPAGLPRWFDEIVRRRPAVGVALAVVRDGRVEGFHGHGLADIPSRMPITEDTVFRIASVTKLFTAIAVMQLWERGLIDLDAPVGDVLRAYRLIPADPRWRPATVRHLLTHTAGIPEIRGLADLLQADLTPSGGRPGQLSVEAGKPVPTLAEYYRRGLGIVVEPGTVFAYTNHGFATLGQIVEDVSGRSLERYVRERILEPLGMADSSLVRSALRARLATGYAPGRSGPKPVPDREWTGRGAGGMYSTARDMARFVAALLGGGANEHGRILQPATLATMFEPHYQPDPRIPGMGLGFVRGEIAGHRVVGHDGILPGFNSALLLAPDDGIAVMGFTNGSRGAFGWLQIELEGLLRRLLEVPDEAVPHLPSHPEIWPDVSGRYVFPARISDLRIRLMMSRGVEVSARGGRLAARLLTPVPVPREGLPLEPADEDDPLAFRLDLSRYGTPSIRVLFDRPTGGGATAVHTDLGGQPLTLVRRGGGLTKGRRLASMLRDLAAIGLAAARRRAAGWAVAGSIDRLSALDAFMLRVSRTWPQDIGALAILDGGPLHDDAGRFRIDAVREIVRRRLHLVPRFRQVIHVPRRGLGRALWVDAPTFDLSRHVRELGVEPPGGDAEVIAAVERLLVERLDPARPFWEMWFLTGLAEGRVGLFVKIHHSVADGLAAMTTVATFLDPEPDAPEVASAPPWEPSPWPSGWALMRDSVRRRVVGLGRSASALAHPLVTARRLRAAWPAIRELLAEEPSTETSLDRMVGPGRRLALIRTSLGAVKAAGSAHDATVNDVLLAVSAGGLRTLLRSRGEPVEGTTVRAYVPVSLRRRLRGVQQGNLVGQMAVPLRLGDSEPSRRLERIAAETTERKARARLNLGALMIGGGIGRRLILAAVMRQRVNVTTASIPGPKVPLHLAGARVLEVVPVLPLVADEGLGIGALSYAGALTIGIAADRDAFPDLDVLAGAIDRELHALGVPTETAPPPVGPTGS